MEKVKPLSFKEVSRIMRDWAMETGRVKEGEIYYFSTEEMGKVLSGKRLLHN